MSFSYDLAASDADDLRVAKVRLKIGDTVEDAGVLPDGGNLSDEEIAAILDENDDDVAATVAELCQILARRWANAVDVTAGPRRESLSQAAKRWADLAREFGSAGATGYAYALERREVSSSGEYG